MNLPFAVSTFLGGYKIDFYDEGFIAYLMTNKASKSLLVKADPVEMISALNTSYLSYKGVTA